VTKVPANGDLGPYLTASRPDDDGPMPTTPPDAVAAPVAVPVAVPRIGAETTHVLFMRQATEIADHVIRPAMDSALVYLARDGGGGRIEECQGDDTHSMRLILWMPLDLDGAVPAWPCRVGNPSLQFTIDVATCRVDVSECDMWEKEGTPSATFPCPLSDITGLCVTQRVIDILRRAAGPGVAA
jgi:hypothetical protein